MLENRLIEFDYYYEKGESHRRIEPCFVIFQWTAWYVFGFCHERNDWRMFKLLRLWSLTLCDEHYTPREIPPERQPGTGFPDDKRLVALFAPSERYKLIESYGLHCFTETPEGMIFERGYTNREHMSEWLLGFGDEAKVLEPDDIAEEIRRIAENIAKMYD